VKRTRLERRTPLRRTGFQRSGSSLTSGTSGLQPSGGSLQRRRNGPVKPRSESTHIPDPIRLAVLERDGYCCTHCGVSLYGRYYSLHHRRARKTGGSKRLHTMANLVALCGSGTTAGSCHADVEANRTDSYATGWLVPNGAAPEEWPVLRLGSWQQPGERWQPAQPHPRQLELGGAA